MIDFLNRKKRIVSELNKANSDYHKLYDIPKNPDYDCSCDNNWWDVMRINIENRIDELERELCVTQKQMDYYFKLYGPSMAPPISNNN
tara:strand:- start:148 stop:411 length:264 start_codon:yes stop_codon:yes gene_type:complete